MRSFFVAARLSAPRLRLARSLAFGTLGGFGLYSLHTQNIVFADAVKSNIDWNAVRAEIVDTLDVEGYDDGSRGPIYVRLAWHAAGTYDKASGTGGSDGATMRFAPESEDPGNAGLHIARNALESVKAKFPDVSYADLWQLAGSVAIEEAGGPKIPFRPGRTDAASGVSCPPVGRLPDGGKHADHVREVFYRMGFNDQEIVALLGAHSLGRTHADRSGYVGPWTRAPTTFSTEFFRLLLDEKWQLDSRYPKKQFRDSTGELMMLPADMALVEDAKFRPYVELYARDEARFFADFAKAWAKLQENGVKNLAPVPVTFTSGDDAAAPPAKPWWKIW